MAEKIVTTTLYGWKDGRDVWFITKTSESKTLKDCEMMLIINAVSKTKDVECITSNFPCPGDIICDIHDDKWEIISTQQVKAKAGKLIQIFNGEETGEHED